MWQFKIDLESSTGLDAIKLFPGHLSKDIHDYPDSQLS